MSSRLRDRQVWFAIFLGGLGLLYIASMANSGQAQFPHLMAALTVLVPMTLFGIVLRSPWPTVGALALLFVMNMTLG